VKAWQVTTSILGAVALVFIIFRIAGWELALLAGLIWLGLAVVRFRKMRHA